MIKPKAKICGGCSQMKVLFSKGLCKVCWAKLHQKPINKVSKKYKQTLKEYKPIRKKFLEERPFCEMNLEGCTKTSVCIHHKKGKHSKALYLDPKYFMASCINCNRKVEEIGETAYQLGFKIRHNGKI